MIIINYFQLFSKYPDPPSVTVTPQDLIVNESDNAVLTCTGFGIPLPTLIWLNDSSKIEPVFGIVESILVNGTGFTVAVSELTIISVMKEDEDTTFTCMGNNSVINLINSPITDSTSFTVQGIY